VLLAVLLDRDGDIPAEAVAGDPPLEGGVVGFDGVVMVGGWVRGCARIGAVHSFLLAVVAVGRVPGSCNPPAGPSLSDSYIISYQLPQVNLICVIIRTNPQQRSPQIMIPSKYLKELEVWLTPAEAGRSIGISKQGMIKRLEEGRQRGVKTHQGWLVDPQDLARKDRR
jgi:hypothetical protein